MFQVVKQRGMATRARLTFLHFLLTTAAVLACVLGSQTDTTRDPSKKSNTVRVYDPHSFVTRVLWRDRAVNAKLSFKTRRGSHKRKSGTRRIGRLLRMRPTNKKTSNATTDAVNTRSKPTTCNSAPYDPWFTFSSFFRPTATTHEGLLIPTIFSVIAVLCLLVAVATVSVDYIHLQAPGVAQHRPIIGVQSIEQPQDHVWQHPQVHVIHQGYLKVAPSTNGTAAHVGYGIGWDLQSLYDPAQIMRAIAVPCVFNNTQTNATNQDRNKLQLLHTDDETVGTTGDTNVNDTAVVLHMSTRRSLFGVIVNSGKGAKPSSPQTDSNGVSSKVWFTRRNMFCPTMGAKRFRTINDAENACIYSKSCVGVYDHMCDGIGDQESDFSICTSNTLQKSLKGSCVYKRHTTWVPTNQPTTNTPIHKASSKHPTKTPTNVPIMQPTEKPTTNYPTKIPTNVPTAHPTAKPTGPPNFVLGYQHSNDCPDRYAKVNDAVTCKRAAHVVQIPTEAHNGESIPCVA